MSKSVALIPREFRMKQEKALPSPLLGDGHIGNAGGEAPGDGLVGVCFLHDAAGEGASEAGLREGDG